MELSEEIIEARGELARIEEELAERGFTGRVNVDGWRGDVFSSVLMRRRRAAVRLSGLLAKLELHICGNCVHGEGESCVWCAEPEASVA